MISYHLVEKSLVPIFVQLGDKDVIKIEARVDPNRSKLIHGSSHLDKYVVDKQAKYQSPSSQPGSITLFSYVLKFNRKNTLGSFDLFMLWKKW
jgi:hypothetical protein